MIQINVGSVMDAFLVETFNPYTIAVYEADLGSRVFHFNAEKSVVSYEASLGRTMPIPFVSIDDIDLQLGTLQMIVEASKGGPTIARSEIEDWYRAKDMRLGTLLCLSGCTGIAMPEPEMLGRLIRNTDGERNVALLNSDAVVRFISDESYVENLMAE